MRTAIVTGGGAGIGKAIALELAHENYRVVVADLNLERAEAVADEINKNGGKSIALYVDLANESTIESVIKRCIEWTGKLHVLVNNAGVNFRYSIENCTAEQFDECISINLKGHYLFSKYAVPYLKENEGASIVNIASTHAMRTQRQFFPYNAAKGGIISMTKSMAIDLSNDRIRANVICPGFIETSISEGSTGAKDYPTAEKVLAYHPSGRIGRPEDIAYAAAFLASEKASFINGETLVIDGGRSALTYTL